MAHSLEKIKTDIERMRKQSEEAGYVGAEYERHEASKPRPPLPLAFRCYYELVPLYEFMVAYAERCNKAGEAIQFDFTILDNHMRYLKVIGASNLFSNDKDALRDRDLSVISIDYMQLLGATETLKSLLEKRRPFLVTFSTFIKLLTFEYEQFPRHISKRRVYNGKHFEALVDRYCERIDAHQAEGKRIAEENVKRRMTNGTD